MTIPFPVYTFHFLYSSCGCSSKGLPAIEELPVSVSTTSKVTLQPTSEKNLKWHSFLAIWMQTCLQTRLKTSLQPNIQKWVLFKSVGEWLLKLLTRSPGVPHWPVGPLKSNHMNCTGNGKCTQEIELSYWLFIYMFRVPYVASLRRYSKSP